MNLKQIKFMFFVYLMYFNLNVGQEIFCNIQRNASYSKGSCEVVNATKHSHLSILN